MPSSITEARQIAGGQLRRREMAIAGHRGDRARARAGLQDPHADVRATALGALGRMGALGERDLERGLADPDPGVRRRSATLAAKAPGARPEPLLEALADPEPGVAEAAAWALGELRETRALSELSLMATSHPDPLCREAAVAALGCIGHPAGLEAILTTLSDRPPVRRRAVLALAPFDGPEVEGALRRALEDRDWQVRQAAEDLMGAEDLSGAEAPPFADEPGAKDLSAPDPSASPSLPRRTRGSGPPPAPRTPGGRPPP